MLPEGGVGEVDVGGEVEEGVFCGPEGPAFVGDGGERGDVDDLVAGGEVLVARVALGFFADGGAKAFDEGGVGELVLVAGLEEVVAGALGRGP